MLDHKIIEAIQTKQNCQALLSLDALRDAIDSFLNLLPKSSPNKAISYVAWDYFEDQFALHLEFKQEWQESFFASVLVLTQHKNSFEIKAIDHNRSIQVVQRRLNQVNVLHNLKALTTEFLYPN